MQKDRRFLLAIVFGALTMNNVSAQDKSYPPRVLAYQYLQKNQVDEAEYAFIKAMRLDPAEILNYRDLAVLYLTKGNYPKAESTVKAGLNIKPADIDLRSVLAKTYIQKGDKQNAVTQLNDIVKRSPRNIFAYYGLASVSAADNEKYLLKALSLAPANMVIRLDLAELLIRREKADSAIFYLQEIKKIAPEFSPAVSESYNDLVQSLRSKDWAKAKIHTGRFREVFKLTSAYIEQLSTLEGPRLSVGYADFSSGQNQTRAVSGRAGYAANKGFTDATKAIGLEFENAAQSAHAVIAVTDYTDAGEMYLYTSSVTGGKQKCHLLTSAVGSFQDINVSGGIDHPSEDQSAAFVDYDNDGYADLFVATTKGILLYKNNGDGTFTFQKNDIGLSTPVPVRKMLFADFDQDGDIDLYASTKNGNKFFRNNGNGAFTEQANAMGLAITESSALDFSDYDGDGDLDIISASDTKGPTLLNNGRHSKFSDLTSRSGLRNPKFNGKAIAFADYDNDGLPDLFIAGNAGQNFLLKNVNGDHFVVDPASKVLAGSLHNVNIFDAAFLDYDNDGYEDLVVVGTTNNSSARAVQLFHNDAGKGFSDASSLLPPTTGQVTSIAIADFNADGDDDLFLAGPGGIKLLRNDIGSLNHYIQVKLTGLSYGNNKNNRLGIGAQVELKSGDLYQSKTIKRSVTNFGLGVRSTVDAARIIWPNGMPQYIKDPSANERIMEEQMLKGSCPFLFAWNGKKYVFIKDMLWRSVLGMTLAIHGSDTSYAFSDPSKEYLLIPGGSLQPKNNKYSIRITEELWEAVFFDKAALIAVDHPDSVNVFADERFVAPPFPGEKVYSVANKHYPLSATDGHGNNVLDKIKAYDFQYISNFNLGKFQGLAEDHDLILDLREDAGASDSRSGSAVPGLDSLYLFLRGWTFPGDASISTSMAQSDAYRQHPPSLQVIDSSGNWKTVIADMGFPMGKDKMVIANLSGKFLTPNDRRVRIQTNMQIYWDEIFFSPGLSKAPVHMHDLTMTSARLGYRGYSAMYRKGGPFGPHWFDYYNTTRGQKWRDLTGYYTRYGNVLPLLKAADDEYIIANSGDQLSIDFDAAGLPALPKGWKRDFLIYSEGWVKDGDLNTAYGQTVAPLPFHAMPSYPYGPGISYPSDPKHRQYQKEYNTRLISTENFRNALKSLP